MSNPSAGSDGVDHQPLGSERDSQGAGMYSGQRPATLRPVTPATRPATDAVCSMRNRRRPVDSLQGVHLHTLRRQVVQL